MNGNWQSYQRGSLVCKNVRGHNYYYIVMREAGKVPKEEIEQFKQVKMYRAKYRKLLSEVNKQIKFLRTTLRGKQSV